MIHRFKMLSILFMLVGQVFVVPGQEATDLSSKAFIRNDTLILQNEIIIHRYLWNEGNIIPISFQKTDSLLLTFSGNRPDLGLSKQAVPISEGKLQKAIKRLSPFDDPYLEVVVSFKLLDLQVKRVIRIYESSPLISHHFELKGITSFNWGNVAIDHRGMIEKQAQSEHQIATIGSYGLINPHWNAKAISFSEATDHYNNLLQTHHYLAYNKPQRISGNVLIATNPTEKVSLIVIKEAPIGDSQHGYPGADFILDQKNLAIAGLGVLPEDINEQSWTRGYGYAIGICAAKELDQLVAIRKHQKSHRKLVPARDEMILSNTWGDRSKDSRMNENFILKEIQSAEKLGITHVQLDDGWQEGLSRNSASKEGINWDDWEYEDWLPHSERFPNGFAVVVEQAGKYGIKICLWFNPSKTNSYENWERDADILIDYYKKWGISVFKIDGIDFSSKVAEENLRKLFNKVIKHTNGEVVFNLDVTADHRVGYHFFTEYGNVFLENRYTDWANYYPHRTLRNLWMLSSYVAPEGLQIEFLNKWRNVDKYSKDDFLAPFNIPFNYILAVSLMAQPLAWMELSQLPDEANLISEILFKYRDLQYAIHSGVILPIGEEPNGFNWTGFQSISSENEGFILVFREHSQENRLSINTWLESGTTVSFTPLIGSGKSFETLVGRDGGVAFELPSTFSFALYRYQVME